MIMSVLDYYNDYLQSFNYNALWLYDQTHNIHYITDYKPLDYKTWLFHSDILSISFFTDSLI